MDFYSRTPSFLGSNGSFGFSNFNSFDQCEANGLNFAQGFRHNKSPVNLYLTSSNSPSANHCESDNNFCYQNNNNSSNNINNNNNIQLNNKNFESTHKNYNSEINSRENSPRIDSPRDKRANTCSPEENSRSFSGHKNDEIGCHSPSNNNDSLGSQSPENLSSKSQSNSANNNNNTNNPSSVSDMLDHKLNLSFLGPPLAALHSMTEMKSQNSPQTSQNSQCATNPHGIDSILSRPTPVTNAHLNALGGMPRFSIAAAAANMAQYLSQNQNAQMKSHSGPLVERTHLYWPGLQGLVANPMAWRERLGSMSASLSQTHHNQDKDGKKKHTRPTFSGQQIFALEKTFEQTKYLAGPERAKLAYALGMTESQVKVWFQNRRTKFRKRQAAEIATAKRKQEELGDVDGDNDGDCSEQLDDSDAESIDLVENSPRKRFRMEDDMRH